MYTDVQYFLSLSDSPSFSLSVLPSQVLCLLSTSLYSIFICTQLFGKASWRKIECQFRAFNTQWDFGSKSMECAKLNILIKYVNNTCWNYFLVTLEMLGYHWKFFGGSRMARKVWKRDKCEKHGKKLRFFRNLSQNLCMSQSAVKFSGRQNVARKNISF